METIDIQNRLGEIRGLLTRVRDASNFDRKAEEVAELEKEMAREDFWSDQDAANKVISQLKPRKAIVEEIQSLEARYADAHTLFEMAREEQDEESLQEADAESLLLKEAVTELELKTLLSGEFDAGNCFLSIHSGAGGTESCDWVSMLRRLFLRWAERHKFKARVLDELPGEEAGLKSVTIYIAGAWAYGYLRSEIGVHRLVRISPFDAKNRRHTSFASVDISPEVEEVAVDINEADLRIDTYRASGAGGQHVNTTDSAVRITHEPTGIVVQCQNERSQHSNRARAMKVLASRLLQHEKQKREAEIAKISGEKGEIGFGSQIRSYVLAPYKLVKDHRTEEESGNVDAVLDGDLDRFTEAFLRLSAKRSEAG